MLEFLKAVLFGIVEGITEWLPISSTGHLILLQEWVKFSFDGNAEFLSEFWEMFEVVIQLGAILAVVVLFWHKLWPFSSKKTREQRAQCWSLWFHVIVACIPAGLAGVGFDKLLEKISGRDINGWLYNIYVVAGALILYGVAFIVIENRRRSKLPKIQSVYDISYKKAFEIGIFQMLSIIPGTSRSGSTIIGSMLLGLSREAAAEFAFFMAVPVMVGASGIKALGFLKYVRAGAVAVPNQAYFLLAVACVVSFTVSMLSIRFLMNFVKRHDFKPFGIYRIVLGVILIFYFLTKVL